MNNTLQPYSLTVVILSLCLHWTHRAKNLVRYGLLNAVQNSASGSSLGSQ